MLRNGLPHSFPAKALVCRQGGGAQNPFPAQPPLCTCRLSAFPGNQAASARRAIIFIPLPINISRHNSKVPAFYWAGGKKYLVIIDSSSIATKRKAVSFVRVPGRRPLQEPEQKYLPALKKSLSVTLQLLARGRGQCSFSPIILPNREGILSLYGVFWWRQGSCTYICK